MDWRRWRDRARWLRDRVSDDSSRAHAVEGFVFVGFLAVMVTVLWAVIDELRTLR
jgi:hypothetical protein